MKKALLCTFLWIWGVIDITVAQSGFYQQNIQPIFNNHCISCHGGTSGVTLSSYESVINSVGDQYGRNIVVPGNPSGSPIVDKISNANPQFGERMPQGGPYLSEAQIAAIIDWISRGATTSDEPQGVPDEFKLVGNYPNPFNPSTVVAFETPVPVSYRLSVYSIDGRLVSEMAGQASVGRVNANVDLAGQPSGVYVYRLTLLHGKQVVERFSGKMTLLK